MPMEPYPWLRPDGTVDKDAQVQWYKEHAESHYAQFVRSQKVCKLWRDCAFSMVGENEMEKRAAMLAEAVGKERELLKPSS